MLAKILSLSVLTFREGVRDRAIIGIGLFAVVMMSVTLVVISLFMRELSKVAVDINLSAFSLSGLLLTFFLSITLMAKDIDKKTIYCVMSKPLSRSQYIWGKYCGILFIILTAFAVLTVFSSLTIALAKLQYANWFTSFSWMEYYKAVYALFLMFAVLNAMVIFFSSITTSSFITLLFSICTYIAGQTIEEVVIYLKSGAGQAAHISEPISRMLDIIQYVLPNLSVFDLKVQASHAIFMSWSYIAWISLYACIYSTILLVAASLIFSKRELS
jgi:ABC-type transport system involved in multi-copper enzyme maturation permease subunit